MGGSNLLRVGSSSFGDLNVLGGASVTANGTLAGVGATGNIWVYGGASLHDSNEISIGYTNTGSLNVVEGGSASSDGDVFLGGFQSGDGEVIVTDSGSQLTASQFIAVGNQGHGSLIISNGGHVSTQTNVFIAGFPGSSGEVNVYDGGSSLSATQQLEVGSAGTASLNVASGSTATAKSVLVGASSTANGSLYVQGSGSKLEVTGGPLSVGNLGMGYLDISDGGKVNVSGGGSFVSVGAESTGNGTLRIEEEVSTLTVQNGPLEVGRGATAN